MLRYLHSGPVLHFLITQRKQAHNYFFESLLTGGNDGGKEVCAKKSAGLVL